VKGKKFGESLYLCLSTGKVKVKVKVKVKKKNRSLTLYLYLCLYLLFFNLSPLVFHLIIEP
jgi:hypothetical protein